MHTICDLCGAEIPEEEANEVDISGEWEGATACNDCYASLQLNQEEEE